MASTSNQVQCPASGWRVSPLATNPTPYQNFEPTSLAYYTTIVLDAAWPAFLGLGAFAALLLSFFLWRLIVVIVRYKTRKAATSSASKPYPAYLAEGPGVSPQRLTASRRGPSGCLSTWSLPAFRGIACAIFLGIFAGSIYGLVESNPQIVSQGIGQVDAVKSYIQHVLGVGQATISDAETINSALADVQTIISHDINVTDVTADLECMRPWLNQLPDPVGLQTEVLNISNLVGALSPLLNETTTEMVKLDGLLQALLQSELQLQTIVLHERAFANAAATVTIPSETPGTVSNASAALSDILGHYETNIGTFDTLITNLQGASTMVSSADTSIAQSIAMASELISGPAAALNGTLSTQTAAYQGVRPCIMYLLDRSQVINATVVQLPDSLSANLRQINGTKSSLDTVLFQPISHGQLLGNVSDLNLSSETAADLLNTTISAANRQLTLSQSFEASLSAARQAFVQSPISALVSQLNGTRSLMIDAQGNLTLLLNNMTAYLNQDPSALPYSTLASEVQSAGSTLGSLATSTNLLLNQSAPLFDQAQVIATQVNSNNITGIFSQLDQLTRSIPSTTTLLQPIDQYAAEYSSLPQPPTTVVDVAESDLSRLLGNITSTIDTAQSPLLSAISSGQQAIATVNNKALGTIDSYQSQYQPEVEYYDTVRQAVTYVVFALYIVIAAALLLAVVMMSPGQAEVGVLLLLLLSTIAFALVVALSGGIKVGTDECANLEQQILGSVSNPSAASVVQYYFYGNGTNVKTILEQNLNLNIDAALQQINSARQELMSVASNYTVYGSLAKAIQTAQNKTAAVENGVNQVLASLEYSPVHQEYMDVKSFACCSALQIVGSAWTALIIAACFSFAFCIQAMLLIGRFDQLPGNWHRFKYYSRDHDILWQVGFNVLTSPPSVTSDVPSSLGVTASEHSEHSERSTILCNKLKKATPEINVR